jgi:hypothetical protein
MIVKAIRIKRYIVNLFLKRFAILKHFSYCL